MRIKRKVLSAILCLCLCLMPLEGVLPVYAYNEDDVFTDRETPETDSYFDHDDVQTADDYAEAEMFSSEQVFEDGTEILTEENDSGDLMTASDDSGYVFEGGGINCQ
ncbi:MAG: hypothetical protein Q4D16_17860 [Eubacteriales bacterium]|nr:hypothetical protein [Eubacteriales bacterium]